MAESEEQVFYINFPATTNEKTAIPFSVTDYAEFMTIVGMEEGMRLWYDIPGNSLGVGAGFGKNTAFDDEKGYELFRQRVMNHGLMAVMWEGGEDDFKEPE